MHNEAPPELTARLEELRTATTWMELLEGQPPSEQKAIVIDLYREGFITVEVRQSLFNALMLAEA